MKMTLIGLTITMGLVWMVQAAETVVPKQTTSGGTVQTSGSLTGGQTQSTAQDVVKRALDSLMGVMSSGKDTQFQKMETFSGCFLNPKIKQKVMLSLVLPQMSQYQILKETTTDSGKNIEVNVTLQQGTKKLTFSLVNRKKQWWITEIK